jgi:hypothetical protein
VVLSITNEFDVFDVYRQSFDIVPGNVYTFSVSASKIVTTEAFETLSLADRDCAMDHETENLTFFKKYSHR